MYWCAHKTATLTSIQHTVFLGNCRSVHSIALSQVGEKRHIRIKHFLDGAMYIYVAFAAGGQHSKQPQLRAGRCSSLAAAGDAAAHQCGLGRGWPTEAIGDYVMKKERLAVDCPLVVS